MSRATVFLATILVLIDADSPFDAHRTLRAILRNTYTYPPSSELVDWCIAKGAVHQPTAVVIDDDYLFDNALQAIVDKVRTSKPPSNV